MADPETWTDTGAATSGTSSNIPGLTPATPYDVRVKATNTAGSATSAPVTATTSSVSAPSAPSLLSSGEATTNSIPLSWAASTGSPPITYQVQYRVSGTQPWSNFGAPSASTSATVTGLSPGTTYNFQVVASNSAGTATSGALTASTLASVVPAGAATNLGTNNVTATSVTLTWSPALAGTPPITYQPEYRRLGTTAWLAYGAPSTATSATIAQLASGTTYEFRVTSANSAGTATSSVVSVATLQTAVAPGAVPNFSITAITTNSATLSWSNPAVGTPPLTYQPQYRRSGETVWGMQEATVTGLSATVTGLNPGTTYEFRVQVSNAAGSAFSSVQSAATSVAPSAPSAPGKPIAWITTPTSVSLTWSGSTAGSPPIFYTLQYRSLSPVGPWVSVGGSGPALGGTASGLTPGEDYDFRVAASNSAGVSYSPILTIIAPTSGPNVARVTDFQSQTILRAQQLDDEFNSKLDKDGGTVGPLDQTQTGAGVDLPSLLKQTRTGGGDGDEPLVSTTYTATWRDGPQVPYGSVAMTMVVSGDPSTHHGPAGNIWNAFSVLQITALRSTTADASGSVHAALVGRVEKNAPAGGVPAGERVSDGWGANLPAFDGSGLPSSASGALGSAKGEVRANGLDDADLRYGFRFEWAENTSLGAGGLPMGITRGGFLGSYSSTATAGVVLELAGLYSSAALDLRSASSGTATITSGSPISQVTTLTVDKGLLFASAGVPPRATSPSNPKAVTINGHAYSVIGVALSPGVTRGVLSFQSPVTPADAATGNIVVPAAHTVWLAEGGDIAFNRSGTLSMGYDEVASTLDINVADQVLRIDGTSAIRLPMGNAAQRPLNPGFGMLRANPETGDYEVWSLASSNWSSIPLASVGNTQAPGPATSLIAGTPTATAVPLSWSAPTTGAGPFNYQVQYRISGTTAWTNWGGQSAATNTTVSGLTPATRYDFQVLTSNGAGTSTSAVLSVTLPAVAPSAPTGLATSNITSTSITLSWTAPSTGTTPIAYRPQYRLASATTWTDSPGGLTSQLTQTINGLTPATSYQFRVLAENGAGSTPSATVSAGTAAAASVAPGIPGFNAGNPTSNSVDASWTAPSTGTAPFTYQPQFKISGTTNWNNFGNQITATSITITGLSGPETYDFRVIANNSAGGTPSGVVSVLVPAAPSAASGTVTGSQSSGASEPVVTGPASGSVLVNNILAVTGITITDASAAATTSTSTLTITASSGNVSTTVSGSQVAGSGTGSITYVNSYLACRQAAQNLVYTGPASAVQASLTVRFADPDGNTSQIIIPVAVTTQQTPGGNVTYRDPWLQPFVATSFWNIGIGSNATWSAPSDPDTVELTSGTGTVNAGQYSMPFYRGKASDPLVTITAEEQTFPVPPQQVRVPATATPAAGDDAHMVFFDETQPQWMWSYYLCRWTSPTSIVCYLGAADSVCGDQMVASGTSNDANMGIGTIRTWELDAGEIKHMLRFSLPTSRTRSPGPSWDSNIPWPNSHEDWEGPTVYTGDFDYGSTIGIPASINLATQGLNAGGMALARCLQRYGAVQRDTGGGSNQSCIFYAEEAAEGHPTLTQMRNDLGKIMPLLRVMRNQSATTVNGGGTYPTPLNPLDIQVCPTGGTPPNTIPTDSTGTLAAPAQKLLNGFGVNTRIDTTAYQSLGLAAVENCINYLNGVKILRDTPASASDTTWWTQVATATGVKFIAYIGMTNQASFQTYLNTINSIAGTNPATRIIAAYEGCQEADIGATLGFSETLAQAAAFQQTVWNAGNSRGLPVIQMSFGAGWDAEPWDGNYETVGNLAAYATYGNAHTYTGTSPESDQVLTQVHGYAQRPTPGKPVAHTQFGWNQITQAGYGNVSQAVAAAYTVMFMFDAFRLGAPYYIYSELLDNAAANGSSSIGMFTDSGNPKPVATTIRNLFTLLTDTASNAATFSPGRLNFSVTGMPTSDGYRGGKTQLLQKTDGSFWLALWNEQPRNNTTTGAEIIVPAVTVTVTVSTAAASMTVYNPANGTTPVNSVTNATSISVSLPAGVMLVKIVKA